MALADEIEAGHVRALVVAGGNPIDALPDPDRMRAALGRLDALVVLDVADSELTGLATHVLPATGQLERADVTLTPNLHVRSAVQATRPVVAAGRRAAAAVVDARLACPSGWAATLLGGADRPTTSPTRPTSAGCWRTRTIDADELFAAGPARARRPARARLGARHDAARRPLAARARGALDRLAAHRTGPATAGSS